MPMTPSGTRIRPTSMPLGRLVVPDISPTGSENEATSRSASAIFPTRSELRTSRSMSASESPSSRAVLTSFSLAARIVSFCASRASAILRSTRFFRSVERVLSSRAAASQSAARDDTDGTSAAVSGMRMRVL